MNLGHKIKSIRKQQNISMNMLAKRVGIAQSTLSRIESGQQMPTFDVLERIIYGLGLNFAEFFADSTEQEPLPPDIRQIIEVANQLTPMQRELIVSVMKEIIKDNNEMD